jgi:Ras family protein T1
VVAGDRGTGKSSLIVALATESFADNLPPVIPPTILPADLYLDHIPVTVVDTSSRSVCKFFFGKKE